MPKDQPAALNIAKSEVVFEGKIWNVVREHFDYSGQQLAREFVAHPGAVAVIAVDQELRVLLIHQYRHPVRSYLWEVPAGLLDVQDESKQAAAERELLEESGYRAGSIEPLIDFYTTPGGNSEQISIFLARELEYVGHDLELEGEEVDMEIAWIPLSEALGSVLRSEMKSPSAQVGIMAAAFSLGIQPQ
jgi:ADP-ribose pyrophosphatase